MTWVRARWVIYALLDSLKLSPVLAYLGDHKHISGFGISDDLRYAGVLANVFNYKNSFYHQEPRLDVMKLDEEWGLEGYDFIICSDVLEHTFGDWRIALENFMAYLKPGGVLILTVPWSASLKETDEYYPGCVDYDVISDGGAFKEVKIRLGDGTHYTAPSPYFHGGPGNTLEMRNFSRSQLIAEGLHFGFSSVKEYAESIPRFGIVVEENMPGVLSFIK
jgi:SAM-dependent methyltransferase